jgi:hypothetical protein
MPSTSRHARSYVQALSKSGRSVASRLRAAQYLAERLFFELKKHGDHYWLYRKIDGFTPQHDLTLEEVEKVLELWKLQGPHGG